MTATPRPLTQEDRMSEHITDEMVEAAARAEWTHEWPTRPWEKVPDDLADHYRDCSRLGLEAAAPAIAAQALRCAAEVKNLERVCPSCGAKAGQRCYGNGEMRRPHSERGLSVSWLLARADQIEAG